MCVLGVGPQGGCALSAGPHNCLQPLTSPSPRASALPLPARTRRVLRFIAHAHGAFLCYLGGLHGATDGSGAEDAALLDNFTRLMNHLIFVGLEKKP